MRSSEPSPDRLRAARERLDRIDQQRKARRLHDAGQPLDDIACVLGVTVLHARRMIAAGEALGDEVSATELILRAAATGSDRAELVAALSARTYTTTEYAPYPFEGARRGTWDEVRFAYFQGYLSADEFQAVRRAAAPRDD